MNPPQHQDVALWRGASASDLDLIFALQSAADAVDHPTWSTPRHEIADDFEISFIDHGRDMLIGIGIEGSAIALGRSVLHPDRESILRVDVGGVVHPDFRRRGLGSLILRWQVARATEQVAAVRASEPALVELPADLKLYADERDRGAVIAAEAAGFSVARWFTTMERAMADAAPNLTVTPNLGVAGFTPELSEATRIARNDAFRDHWGSLPSTEETWNIFVSGEHFRSDLSHVVLDGDRVVAFCLASVIEEDWERLGASHAYIDLIGVVRDRRRQGLAPAVIARTLRAVGAAGLERAVLDVDTASPTGAHSLYEGLGFAATDRSLALSRAL